MKTRFMAKCLKQESATMDRPEMVIVYVILVWVCIIAYIMWKVAKNIAM